jgi:hypothetical protein
VPTRIDRRTTLDEIDAATVLALLDADADEDVYFDFKEGWDSRDPQYDYRVRRALGSFANTTGGFLIFGVLDKRNAGGRVGRDRLVGVGDASEAGQRIASRYLPPGLRAPTIVYEGPRVIAVEGRSVPVVKVLEGEEKPYGIRRAVDTSFEFWTRSSGTAQPMSYDQLLVEVDRTKAFRGWLIALFLEAQFVEEAAAANAALIEGGDSLPPLLDSLITRDSGAILSVLAGDPGIAIRLLNLRQLLAATEGMRARIESLHFSALMEAGERIAASREPLRQSYAQISRQAGDLRQYLGERYPAVLEYVAMTVEGGLDAAASEALNRASAPALEWLRAQGMGDDGGGEPGDGEPG